MSNKGSSRDHVVTFYRSADGKRILASSTKRGSRVRNFGVTYNTNSISLHMNKLVETLKQGGIDLEKELK